MSLNGKQFLEQVLQNINKVIAGKEETVTLMLTAMLADGHVLLEDVPGTGKTKLARAMARSLDTGFSRIQFTPDLLPSDVTGLNIYDRQKNEFVLRKGPVFTNILLADEINRATPRTQAGLLECMEERQVTIDGESHRLEEPFFVIATENPVETAGTFPLPEAQLDRFMMKLSMGIPDRETELAILRMYMTEDPLNELQSVFNAEELRGLKETINRVYVHESVQGYLVDIVGSTRNRADVVGGVSPRGTLAMLRALKAYAWLMGRGFVIPDDVKALAVPVLAHRIITNRGFSRSEENKNIIEAILGQVNVPTENFNK